MCFEAAYLRLKFEKLFVRTISGTYYHLTENSNDIFEALSSLALKTYSGCLITRTTLIQKFLCQSLTFRDVFINLELKNH